MNRPRFSIITPSFNSEKTIQDTIASIDSQNFKSFEHIVIDGLSTDKTMDVLNSQPSTNRIVLSEKDNGIYDAMNKGIKIASGEIVGILNSDDMYIDEHVLAQIDRNFAKQDVDMIYADLIFFDESMSKVKRKWYSEKFLKGSFKYGWHPPHPTLFIKKDAYEKYGFFNLNYSIASDFDLMLRFFETTNLSSYYLKKFIIKMRLGGISTGSLKNILKGNIEIKKSFKANNIKPMCFYTARRFLSKTIQKLIK